VARLAGLSYCERIAAWVHQRTTPTGISRRKRGGCRWREQKQRGLPGALPTQGKTIILRVQYRTFDWLNRVKRVPGERRGGPARPIIMFRLTGGCILRAAATTARPLNPVRRPAKTSRAPIVYGYVRSKLDVLFDDLIPWLRDPWTGWRPDSPAIPSRAPAWRRLSAPPCGGESRRKSNGLCQTPSWQGAVGGTPEGGARPRPDPMGCEGDGRPGHPRTGPAALAPRPGSTSAGPWAPRAVSGLQTAMR